MQWERIFNDPKQFKQQCMVSLITSIWNKATI